MPKYSQATINKAYLAYRETGSVVKASEISGASESAITRWKDRYDWPARIEVERNEELEGCSAQVAEKYSNELMKLAKDAGLNASDIEALCEIRQVSDVCFKAIRIDPETLENEHNIKLYPRTFDSLVKALEKCWEARYKIFNKPGTESQAGSVKVNIVESIHQYFNDKRDDENIIEASRPLVLESSQDTEQQEDNEY